MDIDDSWLGLAIAFLGIVLLALVSAAEGGVLGLKARRTEHPFIERGTLSPGNGLTELNIRTLNVLLVSKTIATTMAVASIIWLAMGREINWAYIFILSAATLFVLSVLQSSYLVLTSRRPDSARTLVGPAVKALNFLMWPLSEPVKLVSFALISILGVNEQQEEIKEVPKNGESEAASQIERDERQMIKGIIELEETLAREIMVPRIDIVAVEVKTPLSQVINTIVERGYSRIPVYEETIDNIIGVLYAKDLLKSFSNGSPPQTIMDLGLREAHFIPENKKVSDLLTELRQKRVHITIVVDEYGGTAGLVTIEDLLEEIVGEIEDEYDPQQEVHIQQMGELDYIIDAKVDIDELNDILGTHIEKEDFDTVGGVVYSKLGKIPSNGDNVSMNGLTISVLSTTGHRIKKVRVTYDKAAAGKETGN